MEPVGARKPGFTDPDDVPEPSDEPDVKPGDLWLLGLDNAGGVADGSLRVARGDNVADR